MLHSIYRWSFRVLGVVALLLSQGIDISANERDSIKASKMPDREQLHLYLLLGQENMVGRGKVSRQDQTPHPRVIVMNKDNLWYPAVEPLHRQHFRVDGVGPGFAFGKYLANVDVDETITIGLVPCAVAGSSLSRWEKGGDLHEFAIERAKTAMKHGTLKGIIWHHGEWDGRNRKKAATYEYRMGDLINDLRAELQMTELPFVMGQLGPFIRPTRIPYATNINDALENISREIKYTACVHAEGLHGELIDIDAFDAESAREMGIRYAKRMLDIQSELAAEHKKTQLIKFRRENSF